MAGRDEGERLGQVAAEARAGEARLAGAEGGEVAAQGVDLAVVGQEAEGLGEVPGGEGVGAVALVRHGQGGGEVGRAQILVEGVELVRQEQAFVDDATRGERADVQPRAQRLLGAAAGDEEPPLQRVAAAPLGRGDEELADARAALAGGAADGLRAHGHLAPGQRREPLGAEVPLEGRLEPLAAEDHRHGVNLRQALDAGAEKGVRQGREEARAVARLGIPPRRAAMGQAAEDGQPLLDDAVAGAVVEVGHQPHAARIVLKKGVVQALSGGQPLLVRFVHGAPLSILHPLQLPCQTGGHRKEIRNRPLLPTALPHSPTAHVSPRPPCT